MIFRDAITKFEPDVEPSSWVIVYVDEHDPDCGLGFVRYVNTKDAKRIEALLEGELSAVRRIISGQVKGIERVMEDLK